MKRWCASLLALGLAAGPLAAADFILSIGNVYWQGGQPYDPFQPATSPYAASFSVRKTSPGNKAFFVTMAPAPTGAYDRYVSQGAQQLHLQGYTGATLSAVWKDVLDATSQEVIAGQIGNQGDQTANLQFFLRIPPGQLVAEGEYSEQYRVSVYSGKVDTGGYKLEDSKVILLSARVAAAGVLAIVPTGSGFLPVKHQDLDFGVISTAQTLGCDILVKHTGPVRLEVTSDNRGRLKLLSATEPAYIPYLFTISGNPLSLDAGASLQVPGQSLAPDGDRLPVLIRVPTLEDPPTGRYRDNLTVTLIVN